MKTQFRNFAFALPALVAFLFVQNVASAQQNPLTWNNQANSDDIVMTWNKNTPETEMKDDIKALGEKGITIKYSGVKRNSKEEITAIKVEYSDRKGNKGKMELENASPIANIKFFKQGDTVGFGEPNNGNDIFGGNQFMNGFAGTDEIMKQFKFNGTGGDSKSFSFSFPENPNFGERETRIMIQQDGKKPLVFQNGELIEGGDDYTKEELDEIKNNNKLELSDGNNLNFNNKEFDFRNQEGLDNYKKQMEKMQQEIEKIAPDKSRSESFQKDMEKTREEMLKAKEDMIKAREELDKAKKELEKTKTKSSLKKQKA